MGHLNVRYYVARAMEGLAGAAAALGMPHAFADYAAATLLVREHHIRFLREARVGAPLHMTAGVVEMGETDAVLVQRLVHSRTDETCATFLSRVAHASAQEGRPFPWPRRARAMAERLRTEAGPDAGPRGVGAAPFETAASLGRADALGLDRTGRGAIGAQDCDVFGRMRTELVMARISAGMSHLIKPQREAAQEVSAGQARIGGAALEYRLIYFDSPRAGDRVELRSGFAEIRPRRVRMNHWLLDPVSGRPWASAENVSVNFDLDARKAVALPAEMIQALEAEVRPGIAM
jgi:acyl-CoA thioester hydrolase